MSLTKVCIAQVCSGGHKWLLYCSLALVALACLMASPSHSFELHHNPWHLKPCNYSWDCGSAPQITHSLLNYRCSEHLCKCTFGYELDHHGKCVKSKLCSFNYDCGGDSSAFCHQGKCRCILGYVRKNDQETCHPKQCFDDSDCYLWSNTRCDLYGACVCKRDYYKSWNSETCLKSDSGNYSYNFLAQNVFTIVIISNFLLWLSIFIFILQYARKRRLAAQEAAATASSMRRTLPPGMPPPPPAYDNIGFEPVTYPPPPPYTPTDANKSASNSCDLSVVSIINVQSGSPSEPQSSSTETVPSNPLIPIAHPTTNQSV